MNYSKVGEIEMYILNERAKEMLKVYKLKNVAEYVGIHSNTLSEMIKKNRPCLKLPAYALTKFLDKDAEISDLFDRKEK